MWRIDFFTFLVSAFTNTSLGPSFFGTGSSWRSCWTHWQLLCSVFFVFYQVCFWFFLFVCFFVFLFNFLWVANQTELYVLVKVQGQVYWTKIPDQNDILNIIYALSYAFYLIKIKSTFCSQVIVDLWLRVDADTCLEIVKTKENQFPSFFVVFHPAIQIQNCERFKKNNKKKVEHELVFHIW